MEIAQNNFEFEKTKGRNVENESTINIQNERNHVMLKIKMLFHK
jgi:hypothetical protein